MKTLLVVLRTIICFVLVSFHPLLGQPIHVLPGIEVLRKDAFSLLQGKRVGLITNPTGVDSRVRSTIDILYDAPGVKLAALFGPEHGVRGEHVGGASVENYTDPTTGLPVYSLYGKIRKPTAEMLKGIDVLVYDIQDIGCRAYTYISTLGAAMEAAAENNIPLIVLDRPNPLGGDKIEGNIVEPGFESFVSPYPIPYVYGLTCGELARLLNGEGMLGGGVRCNLTVVPMKGWKRSMTFTETGLPWVLTSPHVPYETTPAYEIATGIIGEIGVISEGVGYTIPFRVLAAEYIDPAAMAKRMNDLKLPGILFRPIVFRPFYGTFQGKELKGVQLHITDESAANLISIQFYFLQVHNEMYPEKNPLTIASPSRLAVLDKILGSDKVREAFVKRMRYEDIDGYLRKDVKAFREKSAKYLLYK